MNSQLLSRRRECLPPIPWGFLKGPAAACFLCPFQLSDKPGPHPLTHYHISAVRHLRVSFQGYTLCRTAPFTARSNDENSSHCSSHWIEQYCVGRWGFPTLCTGPQQSTADDYQRSGLPPRIKGTLKLGAMGI